MGISASVDGLTREPKLLVAVLQVDRTPWSQIFENGQRATWFRSVPENVSLVNIYGKSPSWLAKRLNDAHEALRWSKRGALAVAHFDSALGRFLKRIRIVPYILSEEGGFSRLSTKVPDFILTLPLKELALFRYFLDATDADYLYLTNTSSYVRLDCLLSLVNTLPRSRVYGGWMRGKKAPFASGANRILSRDVVEIVVRDFNRWDFRLVDDLSMGLLLRRYALVNPTIETLHIASKEDIEALSEDHANSIHFRLKAPGLNGRADAELMIQLHRRLRDLFG